MNIKFDPVIYEGRPVDCKGRLDKEIRTYDLLERLDIPFQRMDHEPAENMAACMELDGTMGVSHCKNLFLRNTQKTKFFLLLLPESKKFRTALLSKQIGSARLSFAEEEFMLKYMDITPGSVSIMGLMNDMENQIQLLIDETVLEDEYMGCHPCVNTSSMKIKTSDILDKFLKYTGHNYIKVSL